MNACLSHLSLLVSICMAFISYRSHYSHAHSGLSLHALNPSSRARSRACPSDPHSLLSQPHVCIAPEEDHVSLFTYTKSALTAARLKACERALPR